MITAIPTLGIIRQQNSGINATKRLKYKIQIAKKTDFDECSRETIILREVSGLKCTFSTQYSRRTFIIDVDWIAGMFAIVTWRRV